MAVNTTEITTVYTALLDSTLSKYAAMWSANEIDAETYAKLVGQSSGTLIEMASSLVQKQEQIDKDLDIKEREMLIKEAESTKQLALIDSQNNKVNQEIQLLADQDSELLANGIKDRAIKDAQINEIAYKVNTLYPDEHLVNAEKLISIQKENEVKSKQVLEEQYKLDALLPDEHNINIAKLTEIATGTTKLESDIKIKNEQLKEVRSSAVLKDKEAVKAGLDNLTKTITAAPEDVYTLKYGNL